MSKPIDVIATLIPKPGKADRIEELLTAAAKHVKETEPGTLRYQLQRETKGDQPRFIMLETYANQAALEAHVKSPAGQELGKKFKEEDLVAEPMKIMLTKTVAGFDSKL